MAIPNNISSDHILKAIEKINIDGIPIKRKEKVWALEYKMKSYPCKLIISYANLFANNVELSPKASIFTTIMAQKYLKSKGFNNIIRINKK